MNFTEHLPALIIVAPLILALFIPMIGIFRREAGWYIALAATFLAFIISLLLLKEVMTVGTITYEFGGWAAPIGIVYVVDYLNSFILVIVAFIGFMGAIYAKKSVEFEIDEIKWPQFYTLYILFIVGMMGIVITGDIFNIYVFIEITSLSGYALIASGRKRAALLASYNYLILGSIGASFILIGIGYLYMVTGTLNMADLRMRLPELYDSTTVRTAFAFFTVGLSLKMALFPLHIWLPNAYAKSPSAVSGVMAATSTKVFAYVLIRFLFNVFSIDISVMDIPITEILLVVSAVAILAGSILAMSQTNIKRMLAYSSVGQIGYIILGAAIANEISMSGSLLHILNHALMKGALFFVVGIVVYKIGTEKISDLSGLGRKMPITMGAFTIGALSMIGVPLTVGFTSKWYLVLGAMQSGLWIFVAVILLSSLLTTVYFWRIVEMIYFGKESTPVSELEAARFVPCEAPVGMLIPTVILAGLCIFFGVAAYIPATITQKAAAILLGGI